jgi:ATP-dependent DNA ligase
MLATPVDELPDVGACRGGCRYEPKWDGWRALLFRSTDGVHLQSRSGKALNRYFPDVVQLARQALPAGAVVDGELIIWDTDHGRTSFHALQRRLVNGGQSAAHETAAHPTAAHPTAAHPTAAHPTAAHPTAAHPTAAHLTDEPAHFVAFDLLQAPRGVELLGLPLSERRRQLGQLLAGAPRQLSLCPQTDSIEQAREWLRSWPAAGVEGLMIKGSTTAYRPGERGWHMLRHTPTT